MVLWRHSTEVTCPYSSTSWSNHWRRRVVPACTRPPNKSNSSAITCPTTLSSISYACSSPYVASTTASTFSPTSTTYSIWPRSSTTYRSSSRWSTRSQRVRSASGRRSRALALSNSCAGTRTTRRSRPTCCVTCSAGLCVCPPISARSRISNASTMSSISICGSDIGFPTCLSIENSVATCASNSKRFFFILNFN